MRLPLIHTVRVGYIGSVGIAKPFLVSFFPHGHHIVPGTGKQQHGKAYPRPKVPPAATGQHTRQHQQCQHTYNHPSFLRCKHSVYISPKLPPVPPATKDKPLLHKKINFRFLQNAKKASSHLEQWNKLEQARTNSNRNKR